MISWSRDVSISYLPFMSISFSQQIKKATGFPWLNRLTSINGWTILYGSATGKQKATGFRAPWLNPSKIEVWLYYQAACRRTQFIALSSDFRDIFSHMDAPPFNNIRYLLTTSGYYHRFLKCVKVFVSTWPDIFILMVQELQHLIKLGLAERLGAMFIPFPPGFMDSINLLSNWRLSFLKGISTRISWFIEEMNLDDPRYV